MPIKLMPDRLLNGCLAPTRVLELLLYYQYVLTILLLLFVHYYITIIWGYRILVPTARRVKPLGTAHAASGLDVSKEFSPTHLAFKLLAPWPACTSRVITQYPKSIPIVFNQKSGAET